MLFYIFFILQVFQVIPQNVANVWNMSMEKPILIYFLIYGCPDCKPYFPIWKKIVEKYDNNENFFLAEANCRTHRILRRIYGITWVPSFVTVYKNQANLEQVESSMESMEKVISKMQALRNFSNNAISNTDSDLDNRVIKNPEECKKIGKTILNYPSFVVGSLFSNPCQKVLKLQQNYPQLKSNFYYTESRETLGYIALRPDKIIHFENNIYSNNFDDFIREFTFQSLGDWNISDTFNVSRRIAFFIYKYEDQLSSYKSLMKFYDSYILFGKIDIESFQSLFPSIYVDIKLIPALAISNKRKTLFTVLNNRRGFNRVLRTILSGKGERLMKHSLNPIFPNVQKENGMFIGLLIMSISVVFTTAYVIIIRARKCINIYKLAPLKNSSFL
ncbi:hypothetical protein M9Y10_028528 [Tritrichomonas musculus]|uniref:Thioredoxin domain-containing protein n=1 Tax=Tritrichomonas musculus TaxID=1915356 RepID=A0ABR2KKN4_9EUKA